MATFSNKDPKDESNPQPDLSAQPKARGLLHMEREYILCGGLYSLWYHSRFWRGPCLPLYNLGEQGYMEILVEFC